MPVGSRSTKALLGTSGTTSDNNTAAPMACDAAIRVFVNDIVMSGLWSVRLIGLTSLSSLLLFGMVTLLSLACDLAHSSLVPKFLSGDDVVNADWRV